MEEQLMESLRDEAINAISKMPDSVDIDEIIYRLYVIDKVRKGREAVLQGDVVSAEELKREIESW
jgi:isopentenyl phosphate kinase